MADYYPFDIDDPAIAPDPYPVFAEMRNRCPVGFTNTRGGFWYVADYDNVRIVFRTPEVFSNAHAKVPAIDDPLGKEIPLELDGRDHALWREVLDPMFSMSRLEGYREEVRAVATGLLEQLVEAGGGDFVQLFSIPFPSRIFCLIMGLPPTSLDKYLKWGRALSAATNQSDAQGAIERFLKAREGVGQEFDRIREDRLENGLKDDVVSGLLAAELDGRPLSKGEFDSVCQMLFVAGLETITATLGNITWFLAEHPEHRQQLIDDPTIIPKSVEELLRYESIVAPGRVVTTDTVLAGQQLHAGDRVMLLTGAAGRDPKAFDRPDEVQFDRQSIRHFAFGVGPHRCLGSHLARMELRIFLEVLIQMMPNFHVTPGAEVVRNMGQIKSFDVLPLTVG